MYPRYFQRKKKMSVNEVRDFLWKHYYQLTGFCKGRSFFNETLQIDKKISNPRISKEHYQSFKRKRNTNLVKESEIITCQRKTFKNPNINDIKSVITEHLKASHKSSKIAR